MRQVFIGILSLTICAQLVGAQEQEDESEVTSSNHKIATLSFEHAAASDVVKVLSEQFPFKFSHTGAYTVCARIPEETIPAVRELIREIEEANMKADEMRDRENHRRADLFRERGRASFGDVGGGISSNNPNAEFFTNLPRGVPAGWDECVDQDSACQIRSAVTIRVPGSKGRTHSQGYNLNPRYGMNAPRILKRVAGDSTAQVRVTNDFIPPQGDGRGQTWISAGLLIWGEDEHFVRYDRNVYRDNGSLFCDSPGIEQWRAGKYIGFPPKFGVPADQFFKGRSSWLKLKREGTRLTAFLSHDGTKWKTTKTLTAKFPDEVSVGLLALNNSSEDFTVDFDSFHIGGNIVGASTAKPQSNPQHVEKQLGPTANADIATDIEDAIKQLLEGRSNTLPADVVKTIESSLTEQVGKLFDLRQKTEEGQLKQADEQLNKIRTRLDERKNNRDAIIRKRVESLMAESEKE